MQQSSDTQDTKRIASSIFEKIATTGRVTDEQLSALHFLFDKHWIKALQIVDQGGVFCFVGKDTGRRVHHVQGNNERYTVFPQHYCSCQAFYFDVVNKSETLFCKHQLATLLADALNKTRTHTVSDLVVAEILQNNQ